jgi:putative phosphoribosyl transferase
MRYADRAAAGRRLARDLARFGAADPVVVGLPRGGVPVAAEVATALGAELDVVLVRKIGAPDRPELAVGAIGEAGVVVRNASVLRELGLTWDDVEETIAYERAEIDRRAASLRPDADRVSLRGRTVLIVDDGIATGATVLAAVRVARGLGAATVVVAVPVAPADALGGLAEIADEVVCPLAPRRFQSVGQWYVDFRQVPDAHVRELLAAHARFAGS